MTRLANGESEGQVVPLIREAARNGDRAALFTLSQITGGAEAERWLSLAAGPARSSAQYRLASAYLKGDGVRQDSSRAVFWLRESARRGHLSAQVLLAGLLDRGDGTPPDAAAAERWLLTAARRGSSEARYRLALRLGLPEGESWLRSAAEQGHPAAQRYLGAELAAGGSLPTDEPEARYWLERAADKGDATAMLLVGLFYEQGRGGPSDDHRAYYWLRKAEVSGEPRAAPFLRAIESRLGLAAAQPDEEPQPGGRTEPVESHPRPRPSAPELLGYGTGFRIGPGLVLTSHHVVDTCGEVRLAGGTAMQPAASVPENDIALFRDPGSSPAWLALRPAVGEVGEEVRVMLEGAQAVEGRIASLQRPGHDRRFMRVDVRLDRGSSGAPVLDGDNRVLGLIVAKLSPGAAYEVTGNPGEPAAFALRVELIRAFLDVFDITVPEGPRGGTDEALVRIECWY